MFSSLILSLSSPPWLRFYTYRTNLLQFLSGWIISEDNTLQDGYSRLRRKSSSAELLRVSNFPVKWMCTYGWNVAEIAYTSDVSLCSTLNGGIIIGKPVVRFRDDVGARWRPDSFQMLGAIPTGQHVFWTADHSLSWLLFHNGVTPELWNVMASCLTWTWKRGLLVVAQQQKNSKGFLRHLSLKFKCTCYAV